jgi:hypothetical protein
LEMLAWKNSYWQQGFNELLNFWRIGHIVSNLPSITRLNHTRIQKKNRHLL